MPMFKRITKPVEARQWWGKTEDLMEFLHWLQGRNVSARLINPVPDPLGQKQLPELGLQIDLGLSMQTARPSDWLIRDSVATVTVLSNEDFMAMYEPVGGAK